MPKKEKVLKEGEVFLFFKKIYAVYGLKIKKGVVKLPQHLLIHQVMAFVHAKFLVDFLGSVIGFVYV